MKKFLALLCALSMILVCFTACGTPKNADSLFKKINKTMEKMTSLESETTITMQFQSELVTIKGEAKGKTLQIAQKDDYYYYTDMTTSFKTNSTSIKLEDTRTMEAYHNGNYYMLNEGEGIDQKIYSELSEKEARVYISDKGMDISELTEDCEKNFTQNEDGSFTLNYSKYGQEKALEFCAELGINDAMFPDDILDMNVTMTADSEYRLTEMKIDFEFTKYDKYDIPTSLSIVMNYTKFDGIEKITDGLSPEGYKQIDDVRALTAISDGLEKKLQSKNESFTLDIEQKISVNGKEQIIKETDKVSYGVDDDGFFYNIEAKYNNRKYTITYSDGTQVTEQGSSNETKEMTDAEAKKFIETLINTAKYASFCVSDITKDENGVYTVTCEDPNPELYSTTFSSVGASYTSGNQTIEIAVKDGNIISIKSTSKANGSGNKLRILHEIESTLTFE